MAIGKEEGREGGRMEGWKGGGEGGNYNILACDCFSAALKTLGDGIGNEGFKSGALRSRELFGRNEPSFGLNA